LTRDTCNNSVDTTLFIVIRIRTVSRQACLAIRSCLQRSSCPFLVHSSDRRLRHGDSCRREAARLCVASTSPRCPRGATFWQRPFGHVPPIFPRRKTEDAAYACGMEQRGGKCRGMMHAPTGAATRMRNLVFHEAVSSRSPLGLVALVVVRHRRKCPSPSPVCFPGMLELFNATRRPGKFTNVPIDSSSLLFLLLFFLLELLLRDSRKFRNFRRKTAPPPPASVLEKRSCKII